MELATFAAAKKVPIVAEFSDVISGKKFNRDGLDAMMAAARRGEFDTILTVKLDRIGRTIRSVLNLIEEFDEIGVGFIFTSQGIDTSKSSACGKLILGVLASCAEFERSLICERTRAGLAVAKANGKILGKPAKNLVPEAERPAIILKWRQQSCDGGYLRLGLMLGGVSGATAWRIAKKLENSP